MKVIFLSSLIPDDYREDFTRYSKLKMIEAASSLQYRFIDGLLSNLCDENIFVLNIVPVSSYPLYYKKLSIPTYNISIKGKKIGESIRFNNLILLKQLSCRIHAWAVLKKHIKETSESVVLISYGNNPAFSHLMRKAKRTRKNVFTCRIIEDLPIYESLSNSTSNIRTSILSHVRKKEMERIRQADCFVLLTEQMADALHIKNKPYVVVEGISTHSDTFIQFKERKKEIVYCGSLHERFGVKDLVESFEKANIAGFSLVICGDGDSREWIEEKAKNNLAISYLGVVSREKAISIQKYAYAIVNPRKNEGKYTQFSFPSKNLEALSIGTPLIAYRLEGIPADYANHIIYVDETKPECLSKTMREVCSMDASILFETCLRSKKWVETEKTSEKQVRKVIDMLSNRVLQDEE